MREETSCPECNLTVAPGDREAIVMVNKVYHAHCFLKLAHEKHSEPMVLARVLTRRG